MVTGTGVGEWGGWVLLLVTSIRHADRHRLTDRPLRSCRMVTGTGVGVGAGVGGGGLLHITRIRHADSRQA